MAREQLPGLLGADSALDVGLGEVSDHRYEGDQGGEGGDLGEGAGKVYNIVSERAQYNGSGDPTAGALHGLVGADAGSELALTEGFADEVGAGVGGEDGHEGVEDPVPALEEVSEKDEVSERPGYKVYTDAAPHEGIYEADTLLRLEGQDGEAEDSQGYGQHRLHKFAKERCFYQERRRQCHTDEGTGRTPTHPEEEVELQGSCHDYDGDCDGDQGVAEPDYGENDRKADRCGEDAQEEVGGAGRRGALRLMFTLTPSRVSG